MKKLSLKSYTTNDKKSRKEAESNARYAEPRELEKNSRDANDVFRHDAVSRFSRGFNR